MFMKAAYSPDHLTALHLMNPSTRTREIGLFMLSAGPIIVGQLMLINKLTGVGSKVILSVSGQTELEVSTTPSSSLSLILIWNRIPLG